MRSSEDDPLAPGAGADSIGRRKDSLRREKLSLREAMPSDVRASRSTAIRERILTLQCWREARAVALFAAIRGEVDLLPLLGPARSEGKGVMFPRAHREEGTLVFHAILSVEDLRPGAFGVPEPDEDPAGTVPIGQIDLLLVPGVAFDARGGRIGFGGGFYDRLLGPAQAGSIARPFTLGVAFECQISPEVPMEPFDRRVDALVTEARSLWCDGDGSRNGVL